MILARCPACATVFRASGDQLKRRAGLVRCGRCRTAFDALAHVVPASPPPSEAPPPTRLPDTAPQEYPSAGAADQVTDSAPDADAEAAPQSSAAEAEGNDANASALLAYEITARPEEDPAVHESHFVPQITPFEAFTQAETQPEAPESEHLAAESKAQTGAPQRPMLPPQDGTPVVALEEAEDTTETNDQLPKSTDEFVEDDAQAQVRAERRTMLAWGSGLAVALVLALFQLVYLYRSEIARASPSYRPMIESLCESLDCRIELPQQAELVSIEASDLQPDSQRKDRLVLSATLKNRAEFAQAYPHIELTLTDSRDQALARRVFPPEVYLSDETNAEAGFPANAEQTVRLLIDATGVGATGYRLYIFYP